MCGEPERGDDAVAFRAVAALADTLDPTVARDIEIRPCGALEVDDLVEVRPGAACLIVDAVLGVPAGELVVRPLASLIAAPGEPGTAGGSAAGPTPRSTHLLPVADVLTLAAIVRPGLPVGSFVGIGGESFGLGEDLSPEVAAALPALRRAIAAEAGRLAAGDPGASE